MIELKFLALVALFIAPVLIAQYVGAWLAYWDHKRIIKRRIAALKEVGLI